MSNRGPSSSIPLNQLTPHSTDRPWREYPAGIGGHNAITTPGKILSNRLSGLSEILFSDEIDIRIIDIRSDNGKDLVFWDQKTRTRTNRQGVGVATCTRKVYKDATEVESVLSQEGKELPRIRTM